MKKVKNKDTQPKEKPKKRKLPKCVVPLILLVVFSVATLLVVLPRLPQKPSVTPSKGYQGVLELWNVETFEGGSGSRSSWITARAAKFEKMHEGLFVHVTNLNTTQLQEKLDAGETFDILCYSRGVGCSVQNLLQPYTGSVANIKNNMLMSGEVDNAVYALPLYAGSYCLFARQEQLNANTDLLSSALSNTYTRKVGKHVYELAPLSCGFTPYNSPLSALAMSGGRGKATADESVSQYAAYENFIANKTSVTLLGTQRDLYRLSKREEMGKIEKLAYYPLSGYTDLVQYLSISATCGDKTQSCNEFLEYAVSETSQQTLCGINMFSVLEQTFYTVETYLKCESGLASAYVPNVFGDSDAIASQRKTAITTLGM